MVEQKGAVVHLTHTDPRCDSRILKEMAVTKAFVDLSVYAIGLPDSSSRIQPLPRGFQFMLLDEGSEQNGPEPSFYRRAINWLKGRLGYLWWPVEFNYRLSKLLRNKKIPQRVELIHVHDYQALLSGVQLKKRTGAKLIYDAHELESDTNGLGRRDSFLIRAGERRLWKHIDGFITVSESIRDHYFLNHPAVSSEIVLNSPNYRNDLIEGPGFVSLRNRLGLSPEEKVFVYLGYLYRGRGIELILDAFNGLPENYHVAFVGSGDLEKEIRASPLFESRVHLVGPVDQENVVPFIADADAGFCLIQPVSLSDYFSLPNKLFECLFAGLPVIGSRMPEIEAIIRRYNAGRLTSFEIEEIRDAVVQVANSDFRIAESSIEDLSWQRQSEKVQSLYYRLMPGIRSATG